MLLDRSSTTSLRVPCLRFLDPKILVAFYCDGRAHLPRTSHEILQSGTPFMNAFALVRNALWTACPSIALVVLFGCGRSANEQSPQARCPTARPSNLSGFPVFTGDFNGDREPDLAYLVQGNTQWSLGIMLSFGSNAPTTVTTPLCPNGQEPSVSFGDVNNDKKLDLVFWCK